MACIGKVGIYLPGLYREKLSMHLLLLGGTRICTCHVLGRLVYMCSLMGWAHLGSGVKLLAYMLHPLTLPVYSLLPYSSLNSPSS